MCANFVWRKFSFCDPLCNSAPLSISAPGVGPEKRIVPPSSIVPPNSSRYHILIVPIMCCCSIGMSGLQDNSVLCGTRGNSIWWHAFIMAIWGHFTLPYAKLFASKNTPPPQNDALDLRKWLYSYLISSPILPPPLPPPRHLLHSGRAVGKKPSFFSC